MLREADEDHFDDVFSVHVDSTPFKQAERVAQLVAPMVCSSYLKFCHALRTTQTHRGSHSAMHQDSTAFHQPEPMAD